MPTPKSYKKLVATKLTADFKEAVNMVDEPWRDPGPGEVAVQNLFAGVNASDVNLTAGRYTATPSLPMDLGFESVFRIVAVGEGVSHRKPGDYGMMGMIGGGYREYFVVDAKHIIPMPSPSPEALTIVVSGLTASIALEQVGEMGKGETVLVTAAAGGTGLYAVQLAKQAGNHVIGTCSTPEKVELLKSLGCDRVINYKEENVKEVLSKEYPRGINLVYESVGGKMFDTAVGALAVKGRLVIIGYVSEYVKGLERVNRPRIYTRLLGKSASIRGFFLPQFARYYREHTMRLFQMVSQGRLQAIVDPTPFQGLESVVDAVAYLHAGQNKGKVVVKVS